MKSIRIIEKLNYANLKVVITNEEEKINCFLILSGKL